MNMRIQGCTEVYTWVNMRIQGLQGCTGVYMGEHENTGVYRSIHK